MYSKNNKKAFTLAETLIVVVILGIIATLTVPNLINKQKETTQRTKVKKAMTTYEQAVNKMLLEHDRSFSNLNAAGCDTKTSYFKYIKRDTANTCIFQTPDKLWWDVSDIGRPMIAFEQSNLTVQTANALDNKIAFVMVGRIDDQGILRVDDLGYETQHSVKDANNYESKAQLEKLYGFVKIKELNPFALCSKFPCEVNGLNWKYKIKISQAEADAAKIDNDYMCSWDPKKRECPSTGGSEVKAIDEDLFISEKLTLTEDEAKSKENCAESRWNNCTRDGDYWNLARRKCEAAGGRLPLVQS